MPVLEAMWELVKRQNISYDIFSGPACYAVCSQSIRSNHFVLLIDFRQCMWCCFRVGSRPSAMRREW